MGKLNYMKLDILTSQSKEDREEREKLVCSECGDPKQKGLLMCWKCWKRK